MPEESKRESAEPCCRRRGRGGGGGAGSVEPAALAALLIADGHGYDIKKTINDLTAGEITVDIGGLYRALRRLEEEGSLVSCWHEDTTGPPRREYELTESGVELAKQWLEMLRRRERCSKLLGDLLEQGLAETGNTKRVALEQQERR